MKPNLCTSVGNIKLDGCIMNASGAHCTLMSELKDLENSESAAIVSKSCTFESRTGNDKPRLHLTELGSVNCMGLPNLGYKFYKDLSFKKPYILSVSNIDEKRTLEILSEIQNDNEGNINLIELNVSCPNVKSSRNLNEDLLRKIYERQTGKLPLGLKLPPYFYDYQFEEVADIIKAYPIKFVTCINSIPNTLIIDTRVETSVLKPNNGLGGLGGQYIKPIGLSNVYRFRKLLPNKIDIIGCGGISTGEDVFEYILSGASAVQVGTELLRIGPKIFKQLNDQLMEKMIYAGYHNISSFQGLLNR